MTAVVVGAGHQWQTTVMTCLVAPEHAIFIGPLSLTFETGGCRAQTYITTADARVLALALVSAADKADAIEAATTCELVAA